MMLETFFVPLLPMVTCKETCPVISACRKGFTVKATGLSAPKLTVYQMIKTRETVNAMCAQEHPASASTILWRWIRCRVFLEFFFSLIYRLEKCAVSHFQGDKEVELGLPFSPLCDRNTTMIAQSQIGKDSGGHSKYKLKMKHRLWINLWKQCTCTGSVRENNSLNHKQCEKSRFNSFLLQLSGFVSLCSVIEFKLAVFCHSTICVCVCVISNYLITIHTFESLVFIEKLPVVNYNWFHSLSTVFLSSPSLSFYCISLTNHLQVSSILL